jgi:5-methylcytosine-specific restriction protein A
LARSRLLPHDQRDQRKRGRAGQRDRRRRLERTHGLCERCLERGVTRLATQVDHTVPLAMGGRDVDGNTRNLCDGCETEVTAEQFGHDRPQHRGVARDGRPSSPGHLWNRSP